MRRALLLLTLFLAAPLHAKRTLDWDLFAVKARLDETGTLHVREEQTMVFTGDWNGGERTFAVGKGERLTFEGISRMVDGRPVPLTQGSLDAVDEYQFDGSRLRWRSRLPSDPAFERTPITYVLEYRLANVLLRKGDRYDFDHDFGLDDRDGVIRRLTVDLQLDPAWSADELPRRLELTNRAPGADAVVRGLLTYEGDGPAPVEAQQSTLWFRLALLPFLVIVPVLLWGRLVAREKRLGRLAPLDTSSIDHAWIERELLPIPPEVIGTAWDETASSAEVAALLARWTGEGKLVSTPAGEEMSLRLAVPRTAFEGYERELIDRLFFAGDETSTSAIRAHYKQSGFDPTSIVSGPLREKAEALAALKETTAKPSRIPSLLLFAAAVALIAGGMVLEPTPATAVAALFTLIAWIASALFANHWRGRIDHGLGKTAGIWIPLILAAVVVAIVIAGDFTTFPAHLGLIFGVLFAANSSLNAAKSKRGPSAIAFRKRLASARQYFIDELQKSAPQIDDAWFPYVIAFGLDKHASKWGESFGGAHRTVVPTPLGSSSSSTASAPRWTGGGGAFGGAGATGSWGAAASGLAAGVASASSSSGGGGGGGRSGGGGCGGW